MDETRKKDRLQNLIAAGQQELAQRLTPAEVAGVLDCMIETLRADRVNFQEFWGYSAHRIAALISVCRNDEKTARKCLELSELAILALKEKAGEVIALPTGRGGRKKG